MTCRIEAWADASRLAHHYILAWVIREDGELIEKHAAAAYDRASPIGATITHAEMAAVRAVARRVLRLYGPACTPTIYTDAANAIEYTRSPRAEFADLGESVRSVCTLLGARLVWVPRERNREANAAASKIRDRIKAGNTYTARKDREARLRRLRQR